MRLKHLLKGNIPLLKDPYLIEYAAKRTFNRESAWDTLDHEFETIDRKEEDLVCYISQTKESSIDFSLMQETMQGISSLELIETRIPFETTEFSESLTETDPEKTKKQA